MRVVGSITPTRLQCRKYYRPDYIASKPCVKVIVAESDSVLLVKRSIGPYLGYWDILGGFLEAGEHPEDGARREILEEARLDVQLLGVVGMYVGSYSGEGLPHTLTLAYAGKARGVSRPGHETTTFL